MTAKSGGDPFEKRDLLWRRPHGLMGAEAQHTDPVPARGERHHHQTAHAERLHLRGHLRPLGDLLGRAERQRPLVEPHPAGQVVDARRQAFRGFARDVQIGGNVQPQLARRRIVQNEPQKIERNDAPQRARQVVAQTPQVVMARNRLRQIEQGTIEIGLRDLHDTDHSNASRRLHSDDRARPTPPRLRRAPGPSGRSPPAASRPATASPSRPLAFERLLLRRGRTFARSSASLNSSLPILCTRDPPHGKTRTRQINGAWRSPSSSRSSAARPLACRLP